MKIWAVIACLMLSVGSTATHADPDDLYALLSCVENAESGEEAEDCIGTGAEICIAAAGMSEGARTLCYAEETMWWSARLLHLSTQLMDTANARDAEITALGQTADAAADSRRVNASWQAYRDAACNYLRGQIGTDDAAPLVFARCMMRRTGEHVVALTWEMAL